MDFHPGTLPLFSPLAGSGLWLLPPGSVPPGSVPPGSGAKEGAARFFVPADRSRVRDPGVVEEWEERFPAGIPVSSAAEAFWAGRLEPGQALVLAVPGPSCGNWETWLPPAGSAGAPDGASGAPAGASGAPDGCRILALDPAGLDGAALLDACRRFDRVRLGHRWVSNPRGPLGVPATGTRPAGAGPAGTGPAGAGPAGDLLAQWEHLHAVAAERRWWEQAVELMEEAGAAIHFRLSAEGVIEYISPQIREYGFPNVDEVVGSPYVRFVHPDDFVKLADNFSSLRERVGRVVSFRVRNPAGEIFQVRSMSRWIEAEGQPPKLVGLMRDVSREERAEGMLERAGRLASVLHQTSGVLFGAASMEDLACSVCRIIVEEEPFLLAAVMDADRPGTVMGAWHRKSGQECREVLPPELVGFLGNLPVTGTVAHPHLGSDPAFERFRSHLLSSQLSGLVLIPLFRPGRAFSGLLCVFVERPNAIEPEAERLLEQLGRFLTHGILAIQDRQDMGRALGALAFSEERHRHILENVQDVIFSFDADSVLTFVGGNVRELFGLEPDRLVGLRFVDMAGLFPDLDAGVFERYERLFRDATAALKPAIEWEIELSVGGERRVLEVQERIHYDDFGNLVGSTGVMRDISERRRALRELERNEAKYRALFELSADGVFLETLDGDILDCNEAAARMHGFTHEELVRLSARNLVSDKVAASFETVITEQLLQGGFFVEAEGKRKDGTIFPTEVSTRLFQFEDRPFVMVSVRDVTERRRREQEREVVEKRLRQSQRVESLQLLASKLAHDFNNLLVGILGNASLGLMDVSADDPVRVNLEEIERAAEEAAQLSRQLLIYAGGWKPHLVPVRLDEVILMQAEILQATVPDRVRMIYRIEPGLRPVMADPDQCAAMVSHVCSNSLDAIGERGGMITISLYGCEELPGNPQFQLVPEGTCDRGPYCCLEIADSGEGIASELLERIFDPYFSTKAHAAGMGLVAVAGIVRSHNAALHATSLPSQGTVFRIFFPYCQAGSSVAAQEPAAQEPAAQEPAAPRHNPGANPRVLIIDDDLWVRNVAGRTLSHAGFECLLAADGLKGVEAARALLPGLALVLLDLQLPGLPGNEVFRQLRQLGPELPILISSGWAETLEPFWSDELLPPSGYLPKPYAPSQLLEFVSRILDRAP